MKTALLLIDIQNDYFTEGKHPLYHAQETLETAKKLKRLFEERHVPVYYIQHIAPFFAPFFAAHTKGADIHEALMPCDPDTIIIKHTPNSFHNTRLQDVLKAAGIKKLVICGMMTHMCVDTTIRCAKDLGYRTILISDACTTSDLHWNDTCIPATMVQAVYLSSLHPRFAKVMTYAEYTKHVCHKPSTRLKNRLP